MRWASGLNWWLFDINEERPHDPDDKWRRLHRHHALTLILQDRQATACTDTMLDKLANDVALALRLRLPVAGVAGALRDTAVATGVGVFDL